MKFLAALALSVLVSFGCSTGCHKGATVPTVPADSTKIPKVETISKLPLVGVGRGKSPVYIIRLTGEVDEDTAKATIVSLAALREMHAEAVVLEINSEGGEVEAGFVIAKAIEDSQAPVHCVVDGEALSMAYFILQSCDTRSITPRSKLMAHNPHQQGAYIAIGVPMENVVEHMRGGVGVAAMADQPAYQGAY